MSAAEEQIMYITIDMDNLVFLHKHADHEVASALSWMECGVHRSIIVSPTDKARFLKTLSPMELRMLYKNTTGGSISSDDSCTLRYQLVDAVSLVPCTRAMRDEVLEQAAEVDERVHAGEVFKYAFGARHAAQPQELFPLRGRQLTGSALEQAAAWARSDLPAMTANAPCGPYPARRDTEADEPALTTAPDAPPALPPLPPTFKKAKRVNAKIEIWAAADKAWRAAGEPKDPEVLKTLWKGVLPELEAQGLHPTTCRIKLAEWAKERASQ